MSRTDTPMRRYLIHALMIALALVAVVPIYVVLINATRTTEQINSGLSLLPGKGAFWPQKDVVIAKWDETKEVKISAEGEEDKLEIINLPSEGTVRYLDLIMGTTMKEQFNKKTNANELVVVRIRTESRQPRIVVVDDNGERLALFNLSDGAVLFTKEGSRIKKGDMVASTITPPNVVYNWRALTQRNFQIWQGFGNSAFIAICTTLLCVYFSALTAYGLHVYRFKGRTAIWILILIIMMLPGSLTFIGFYQLMARWRLVGTYIPLIIPSIAAATTVLFIRQYMKSVLSFELIDAARIDGAGEYRIFNSIILPVAIPALAAQAIFTFVGSWNNLLTPSVIISDQKRATLPMLIYALRGDIYRTEYGGIYLGIAISLIPIIIFYSLMSRFIISGLTMGGIKE
ncbi:MAG: ABC transporter permease subunit [Treponema sp.]|nr:ABC transporter permease subunit [Treponema sp.]